MTEEIQIETISRDSQEPQPAPHRARAMRRTYIIAILFFVITIVDSLAQYAQFGSWQILADGAGIVLGLAGIVVSFILFNRGKISRAVSLIPFVLFVAYAPGDLFLEGVTLYNLVSGVLLFGLTFMIFRPKNTGYWAGMALVYILAVLTFSRINAFPRFDITQSQSWALSLPIITAAISVLLIWQVLSNLQIRTIRTRLLLTFMAIGLIPTLIITAASTVISYQRDLAQAENSLNSALTIKAGQINDLYQLLQDELSRLQQDDEFSENAEFLLAFTPTESSLQTIKTELYAALNPYTGSGTNFSEIFLIDRDGLVKISSSPQMEGENYARDPIFTKVVQSVENNSDIELYSDANVIEFSVAQPVLNDNQELIGVIVGRTFSGQLAGIVQGDLQLIQEGNTYLVSGSQLLLTPLGEDQPFTVGDRLRSGLSLQGSADRLMANFQTYENHQGVQVIGISRYIPEIDSYLVVEQTQSVAFRTLRLNLITNGGLAALTFIAIIFISISSARSISQPLSRLSQDASKVWRREINTIDPIDRQDEIGELSVTLSSMTDELVQTAANLEEIVSDRTRMLERRATYLQTTSEISKALTGIYNLENLLNTVTFLISENFGFYHVGIFMIDDKKEYAVLKAANSEGGWRMLAREHRLKVGEQGIVGFVTGSGQPRIQQQVAGEDSVYYNNPDLPLTKSELALPLKAGNEIFGALDVQSTEEEAFSDEDVSALQVLADAVAVAIQNTRLVQQLQESLETERKIYGELTSSTWKSMLEKSAAIPAFKSDMYGVQTTTDTYSPLAQEAIQSGQTAIHPAGEDSDTHLLAVPVRVRGGAVVAVIETQKPAASGVWTTEEITILESVGTEMGMAIENARLFEETQRTAQRERISANLSSKIWASTDVENILQTTVRELGSALNISLGTIKLTLPEEPEPNGNQDGAEL